MQRALINDDAQHESRRVEIHLHSSHPITTHGTKEDAKVTAQPRAKQLCKPRKKISDFDKISLLGEGAFGKVFKVKDRQDGKVYALKRIEKQHLVVVSVADVQNKKEKQAFIEREMMMHLESPHTVQLFHTFQDKYNFYYLMELVPNGSLQDIACRHSLTMDTIRFYSAQLISLLQYLHWKGVVHRDLKPENLLLDDQYHLKLIDFATCKYVNQRSDSTKQVSQGSLEEEPRKGSLVGT